MGFWYRWSMCRPAVRPRILIGHWIEMSSCQSKDRRGRFELTAVYFWTVWTWFQIPTKKINPLASTHLPRRSLKSIKIFDCEKNSNNWHRMWLYQHVINRKKIFRKFSLRKNRWLDLSKAKLKALKEALDDVIDVVEALERNELIKNSN